ncbi:MAG TPA: Ig-like domain-containing protein [Candidatus Limnocylindrales bacterium]|nr:Ig-like domain-containing protein [Candidatus Limnocylindrales bacterium]
MRGLKGRHSLAGLVLVFLFGFLTLQLGEPLKAAAGPIKIVSPLGGSVVSGSVRIALSMRRRTSFAKVYVDGVYLASTPGTISWLSTGAVNGMHTVSAKAYDSANRLIGTSSRMIRVKNRSTPTPTPTPTAGHVTITSPSSGATVSGTVSIAVSVSSVSWVNFYVDGSWIASSPPYTVGWDSTGVSNGLHSISVNGYNSSNALVATALSSINVQNGSSVTATPTLTPTVVPTPPPPTPPAPTATPTPTGGVSITAPKSGATVSGTVSITAVTTAPVVWVNYYIDGNWMVSSPPFTVSWNSTGVANGPHTIAVNGYNSSNALVATNALNVSVQNGAGATPTPTKLPTATPTSTSTAYYSLLPKGSTLPTDSQCAAGVAGDKWDPRPANAVPNSIMPTASEMATYKSNVAGGEGGAPGSFLQRADGQFTGGTDAILKWASCKWGFDENVTRATAVNETHWRQTELGDVGNGISLGILQVKSRDYPATCEAVASSQSTSDVTNPNCFSYLSTAFDADYKLAQQRACFEGQIDYMIGESPAGYPSYPNGTPDQMMWGCVGWWYSGHWYDSGAVNYISEVKGYLSAKTWAQPGF